MKTNTLAALAAALLATATVPSAAAAAAASPVAVAPAKSNRAVMQRFTELLYGRKQVREAYEAHVAADLIQHNPTMADGRDAAIAALTALMANPAASFEVKRIVVEGDLAVVHYHGRLDPTGPGAAVVEIFRLSKGKIVEHWDVFQMIPAKSANTNTMF